MPGRLTKFEPDEYRTPYLKQAIVRGEADPISRFVDDYRGWAHRAAVEAIETLGDLVRGRGRPDAQAPRRDVGHDENALGRAAEALAGVLPRPSERRAPATW